MINWIKVIETDRTLIETMVKYKQSIVHNKIVTLRLVYMISVVVYIILFYKQTKTKTIRKQWLPKYTIWIKNIFWTLTCLLLHFVG